MKLEDICEYDRRQEYPGECDNCKYVLSVRTQHDNYPEYYTNVYVKCPTCGEWIHFSLPVN